MGEWVRKTISEIGKVQTGSTPKTSQKSNYGNHVSFVKPADFLKNGSLNYENQGLSEQGLATARLVEKDSVLMVCIGATIGKVGFTEVKVTTNQQINSLTPLHGDSAKFIFYQMLTQDFQKSVLGQASQATLPIINKKKWSDLSLRLPPIVDQKRIVAILDEAFEGIDVAIANTEKNLANARELFESYLNAIFTRKGDDCKEVELGSLSERITKGSSPKWQGISYVDEPGVLFVTSENVGQNQMIFDKTKYVEEAFNEKDSKSILACGDVLTNIVGASIGRTAIYDRDDVANINQAVCLIRCKSDKLLNNYLAYLLNSPYFRKILHDNEINNARANLSLTFFRQLKIPLPSLQEQQYIVSRMDAFSTEAQRLEAIYQQKLAALNELKQSILQKAFSGELTAEVGDAAVEGAKEVVAA